MAGGAARGGVDAGAKDIVEGIGNMGHGDLRERPPIYRY
jgi:hypothetical protein